MFLFGTRHWANFFNRYRRHIRCFDKFNLYSILCQLEQIVFGFATVSGLLLLLLLLRCFFASYSCVCFHFGKARHKQRANKKQFTLWAPKFVACFGFNLLCFTLRTIQFQFQFHLRLYAMAISAMMRPTEGCVGCSLSRDWGNYLLNIGTRVS